MRLSEIIVKAIVYILIAPLLSLAGAAFAVMVLLVGVLISPAISVVSLFFREPYEFFAKVYTKLLEIASVPFEWLVELLEI